VHGGSDVNFVEIQLNGFAQFLKQSGACGLFAVAGGEDSS
jgi:hypothetical protein